MIDSIRKALSSRNGFVRKGAAALLAVPKRFETFRAGDEDFAKRPAVLANSFPKSGTHLLAQVVEGLPYRVNYGAFLASQTSSFRFRERTADSTARFIRGIVPGEVIRGHLYFDPQYARELAQRKAVHYFIYRDPRAVVVSEAHYLRKMNRWHRLAPYFRRAQSMNDAIMLSITGLDPPNPGIDYPNIAERFARYEGWLCEPECFAIRYEELNSERKSDIVHHMAEFYVSRASCSWDVESCAAAMLGSIAPQKSHTFRSGERAGWQREFTAEHRRQFVEVAGDLLIRLGYEKNHDWANVPLTAPV